MDPMRMKCPYLIGKYMLSCGIDRQVYVPSRFELNEYCTSMRYTLCPLIGINNLDEKGEKAAFGRVNP
jgi:hypothetical protein